MSLGKTLTISVAPELAWYAVYTRHQHEKAAAENLKCKGFEVFLPLYIAAHKWKDRTKKISVPLFPCYLFLRGGLERRVDLLSAPGVCSLVTIAGRPAFIPREEVEAVQRIVEGRSLVEPVPFLRFGDRVKVQSGPLAGVEGIYVRSKDGSNRLVISIELLQRSVAVDVEASSIVPICSIYDKTCGMPLQQMILGSA
jgi:transcription antitermination factor NusG